MRLSLPSVQEHISNWRSRYFWCSFTMDQYAHEQDKHLIIHQHFVDLLARDSVPSMDLKKWLLSLIEGSRGDITRITLNHVENDFDVNLAYRN